jgi:hypothetical protein
VNPWPFVIAAYGLAALTTIALAGASYVAMRRAERAADTLRKR